MTSDDENQLMLPGLELGDERTRGVLRSSVVITLDALRADGLLEARHTATSQLALMLADAVEQALGARVVRASAVAMAARELRETLAALPQPADADAAAAFALFTQKLELYANGSAT